MNETGNAEGLYSTPILDRFKKKSHSYIGQQNYSLFKFFKKIEFCISSVLGEESTDGSFEGKEFAKKKKKL